MTLKPSLILLSSTLVNFIYRADMPALIALLFACALYAGLEALPYALDSGAEALRKELGDALAKQTADIESLKNKLEMHALRGRA